MKAAESDLGRVEELAALFGRDGADEDAVRGAGYEVADAFVTGEQGHGVAIGFGCGPGGIDIELVVGVFRIVLAGLEGTLPGSAAAAKGGFGVGRIGARPRGERGGGRIALDGFKKGQFFR